MGNIRSKQKSINGKQNAIIRVKTANVENIKNFTKLDDRYNEFRRYKFPFENIVLEGGGVKGIAYCGVIRLLEDIGMWEQICRIAGASAGALAAALLCVGYTGEDLEIFLSQNLSNLIEDHHCGYCCLLPNIIHHFGWNPGSRVTNWIGEKLRQKCGNPDITFKQLYEKFGKELCVVVTNVNSFSAEYCHVKTTPHMPIRLACRMSMAIPGIMQAVRYKSQNDYDYYVDGGLLCNFPIHCFDGWYLSLKPEDSFLKRVFPLQELGRLYDKTERFGTYNEKTLGFLLYSEDEPDILQYLLEARSNLQPPTFPKTKLSMKRPQILMHRNSAGEDHDALCKAAAKFLQILREFDVDEDGTISRDELRKAVLKMQGQMKNEHCLELMFGRNASADHIFDLLDRDMNEEVTFAELSTFLERKGVDMQAQFLGYKRRDIDSVSSFVASIQDALLLNSTRAYVENKDIDRMVGINTSYIGTTDFNLEKGDRELLIQQGERATIAFLKHYIQEKKPPLKVKQKLLNGTYTSCLGQQNNATRDG